MNGLEITAVTKGRNIQTHLHVAIGWWSKSAAPRFSSADSQKLSTHIKIYLKAFPEIYGSSKSTHNIKLCKPTNGTDMRYFKYGMTALGQAAQGCRNEKAVISLPNYWWPVLAVDLSHGRLRSAFRRCFSVFLRFHCSLFYTCCVFKAKGN